MMCHCEVLGKSENACTLQEILIPSKTEEKKIVTMTKTRNIFIINKSFDIYSGQTERMQSGI